MRFVLHGTARLLTLVGSDEADRASGMIAFTTPLACALMGGETGDLIDFAGTAEAIEILAIE